MTISKELFKDFALSSDKYGPFDYRNSTSRLYYYLYHLGFEFLDGRLVSCDTGGSHERLCKTFIDGFSGDANKRKLMRIGYMLTQAKKLRHEADYDLLLEFDERKFQEIVDYVDKIESIFQELSKAA